MYKRHIPIEMFAETFPSHWGPAVFADVAPTSFIGSVFVEFDLCVDALRFFSYTQTWPHKEHQAIG